MTDDHPAALLILIRGLPGSGKTYFANALYQHLDDTVVKLDPDAIDFTSEAYKKHTIKLAQEGVDFKLHPYRFLRAQAYKGIEAGQVIVWNQPFTNLEIFHKMLDGLKKYAAEHNAGLNVLIVEVEVDPGVAHKRVKVRKEAGGHGPSESTFQRFTGDYISFAGQGYPTLTIYGQRDVQESVQTVLDAMRAFGR